MRQNKKVPLTYTTGPNSLARSFAVLLLTWDVFVLPRGISLQHLNLNNENVAASNKNSVQSRENGALLRKSQRKIYCLLQDAPASSAILPLGNTAAGLPMTSLTPCETRAQENATIAGSTLRQEVMSSLFLCYFVFHYSVKFIDFAKKIYKTRCFVGFRGFCDNNLVFSASAIPSVTNTKKKNYVSIVAKKLRNLRFR